MKRIKKEFDINAHITDIKCNIIPDGSSSTALISLNNLGYGVITAIKFNATGYNSFGDIVHINGNEQFYLIIQDIAIEKNAVAENLTVTLPNNEIKKLFLEECQICYDDGSVVSYSGSHKIELEIEEFDETIEEENEQLIIIQDVLSENYKNLPQKTDDGWLCGCGRYNKSTNNNCSLCGLTQDEVFKIQEPDFWDFAKEQHRINEEEHKKQESIKSKEKAKNKIKGIIAALCFIIVGAFLVYLIGHSIVLSKRATYSSEEQMRADLQGTYTYSTSLGPLFQIVIEGDTLTYRYSYSDDLETDIEKWDYRNGKIKVFKELIVTKEGNIKDGDYLYLRGGSKLKKDIPTTTYNYENGFSVLVLSADSLTSNSSYKICTGSVKNTGKKTYKYVKVKGAFKGSNNNVLDTDWTYAVGSEGLAPGETSTFRLSVPKNRDIISCDIYIQDYQ